MSSKRKACSFFLNADIPCPLLSFPAKYFWCLPATPFDNLLSIRLTLLRLMFISFYIVHQLRSNYTKRLCSLDNQQSINKRQNTEQSFTLIGFHHHICQLSNRQSIYIYSQLRACRWHSYCIAAVLPIQLYHRCTNYAVLPLIVCPLYVTVLGSSHWPFHWASLYNMMYPMCVHRTPLQWAVTWVPSVGSYLLCL